MNSELLAQYSSTSESSLSQSHLAKLDINKVPVAKDIKELVTYIHQVFAYDSVNIDYVVKLLQNYTSNPKDWRQYAKYDPHKYTRNLIDEGNGKFNILLLCWAESQGSSIHDHSNSHCFMKCLDGELIETRYEWPDDSEKTDFKEMIALNKTSLKKNEVCYINDSLGLHRVENISHSRPAVTLHIYIPAFSESQAFDQLTGKAKLCQITFYSKYVEILSSNIKNNNNTNNNNNYTYNNTANTNIYNLIQTVELLPRPPALPPPPPQPPLPPLQTQFISVSRSAFGYLSLKQHAYNSYTHLRNHINEINNNLKKTNRSHQQQQQQCAKIELASLDYLSYEISNKAQHINTYLKVSQKTNLNILDLTAVSTITTAVSHTSNHTPISSTTLHYLAKYNADNNVNNTSLLANTAGAAMYDLLPVKDSFQFLINILIVPIIFFSIFILILIINMILNMLKRKKKINKSPSLPSTATSTTSSSISSFEPSNRTSSYTSTLNSSVDENTYGSIVRKSSLKSANHEDYSIYLTEKHVTPPSLPSLSAESGHYKKNINNRVRLNRLKRLKSFTTVSSNFSTIFTKTYDLNAQHNHLTMSNKDLNEVVTHDCVYLYANNTLPNLRPDTKPDDKKFDIIHESPFNPSEIFRDNRSKLSQSQPCSRVFPRTNPHYCRPSNITHASTYSDQRVSMKKEDYVDYDDSTSNQSYSSKL